MTMKLWMVGLGVLGGCATYSETFECGVGPGVGCKSLSQVNAMVENGQLPVEDPDEGAMVQEKVWDPPASSGQRVWMAPYRDEEGHMHEGAYIRLRPQP